MASSACRMKPENPVEARDRASSPIINVERDTVSCAAVLVNDTSNHNGNSNPDTEISSPTAFRSISKAEEVVSNTAKLLAPNKPDKLPGSLRSNTSEEDQRALITRSSTYDTSSNSEALSQPVIVQEAPARITSPKETQFSITLQPITEGSSQSGPKPEVGQRREKKSSTKNHVVSPTNNKHSFSVFLSGSPNSENCGFPRGRQTVTTSLRVHRIYPKPPRLRREAVEGKPVPRPSSEIIRPLKPFVKPDGKPVSNRFVTKPMNNAELPENKGIEIKDAFDTLNANIQSIILRLHDFNVIPGGPWRGIIYLVIKKTIVISDIILKIEECLKISSDRKTSGFEKREEHKYTCMSSDSTKEQREPPGKFTYDLSEFQQSATATAKRNETCYLPYYGPVEFKPGHYAIPCIFPISSTSHPSFSLRQDANTPNASELLHSYHIYATLRCLADDSNKPVEIDTGKLPLKVMSCGPLPQELDNGDIIPALVQTFALSDVNLMFQTESLTVQDGDTIRFYLFADKIGVIKHVRGFLLQAFHVPCLNIGVEKSSQKDKKLSDNVVVRDQTEPIPMTTDFATPFSPEAEAKSVERLDQSVQQCGFYVSSLDSDDQISSEATLTSPPDVPWEKRKAGCTISLNIPTRTVPQINMEQVRVVYYARIIVQLKKKTIAYSIPISVVETRLSPWQIRRILPMDQFYSYEGPIMAYPIFCKLDTVYEKPFCAKVRIWFDLERHPLSNVAEVLSLTKVLMKTIEHENYGLHIGEVYKAHIVKVTETKEEL
ncbi:unnamed protein product [Echinostoma caproni]|uniref:Death domain-containing protein n=1 Tax=Echinostoma caproni TaxID=27848 RepID=A0A183A5L5_9TREM|nr:unnamed protein product [Echinostoma caproni]